MADFTACRLEQRRQEWLDEWASLQDDVEHWNRTHPEEKPIMLDPITQAEIEAHRG